MNRSFLITHAPGERILNLLQIRILITVRNTHALDAEYLVTGLSTSNNAYIRLGHFQHLTMKIRRPVLTKKPS